MLAKYFRGGLGQLLAPDKNYVPEQEPEGSRSLLQIIAPDPKFAGGEGESTASTKRTTRGSSTKKASAPPDQPPASAFMSPAARRHESSAKKIECEHCHKLTATPQQAQQSPNIYATPTATTSSGVMVGSSTSLFSPQAEQVRELVWEAVEDVAKTMGSPAFARKPEIALFEFCANKTDYSSSSVKNNKKLQKQRAKAKARTEKMLQNDPALFRAHACNMGSDYLPDGYTPLMAAAHADNHVAAEILCRLGPTDVQLQARNFQGKTALHIASERGHVKMVEFLRQLHNEQFGVFSPRPVDMNGRTPYGSAMTSPDPKARTNRSQLSSMLYEPNDVSILGTPAPAEHRIQANPALSIVWGFGDMPGKRITMEDAMFAAVWGTDDDGVGHEDNTPTTADATLAGALFGVCDGHADSGRVSRFIAQEFPTAFECGMSMLSDSTHWQELCEDICLAVDDKLKLANLVGGSTAVLACVTPLEIVLANVGDSRAILIQQKEPKQQQGQVSELLTYELSLDQQTEQLSFEDKDQNSPVIAADTTAAKTTESPSLSTKAATSTTSVLSSSWEDYQVIALSQDHKPSLPAEKARVEAAGLTVVQETFVEDGQEQVISKVAVSDDNRLATSRAFGDFEYKANDGLTADQQAVVAVPDVTVHRRNDDTDAYLVLACDGIWDVMSNEQVGQFVVQHIHNHNSTSDTASATTTTPAAAAATAEAVLPAVADRLLAHCLELGSTDNMSVLIVALSKAADQITGAMSRSRTISPEGKTKKALNFEPAESE